MNQELEKLINEIQNHKIKSILQSGENSPLQKMYIEPALETLAREIVKMETGLRRLSDGQRNSLL